MATILFLPYSHQLGTTYGLIDIAINFRTLGDNVVFAGEGKFLKFAQDQGFTVEPLSEIPYDKYRKHIDNGNVSFHDYRSIKEHVRQELDLYRKWKPDLVISQGRTTSAISSRIAKIKLINVNIAFLTGYYGLKFPMPETFKGHFLSKIPVLGHLINSNTEKIARLKSKMSIRPYNKVLKEYNHEILESMYDVYNGTYLTLVPENEALFPLSNKHPKEHFIFSGPLLQANNFALPDWYPKVSGKFKKCIYLSMGSSSDKLYPILLDKLIDVFGNNDDYNIISNTCYLPTKNHIKLPDNFFIAEIAPANMMLSVADVTICHGGKGTIYHSLSEGVPILGIPQQAEQEINLRRIKDLGFGNYILSKKILKFDNNEFKRYIDELIQLKSSNELNTISALIKDDIAKVGNVIEKIHKEINK